MTAFIQTRDQAKARARMIRAARDAGSDTLSHTPMSHAAALEYVAAELGYRNWNALSARLPDEPEEPLRIGDRVAGLYLKQPFRGVVTALRGVDADGRGEGGGGALRLTIRFDQPLDVVTFDSFSAFRSRVHATITPGGVSHAKTSDGVPHLVVGRVAE